MMPSGHGGAGGNVGSVVVVVVYGGGVGPRLMSEGFGSFGLKPAMRDRLSNVS